jgi:hypothetical protein
MQSDRRAIAGQFWTESEDIDERLQSESEGIANRLLSDCTAIAQRLQINRSAKTR